MTSEKDKQEIGRKMKEILGDKAEFALLFGSLAADKIHEHSDIDVAVYLKKIPENIAERLSLRNELSRHFYRDVDLVLLNDSDIIITMQALANGELIINNNPHFFIEFKARKLGEYADFKISRRIIENNLLKGGPNA